MPSTYSPLLQLELIANGEQSGFWGTTTNNNLGSLVEQAIAGTALVDISAGDTTLTVYNGSSDQARCAAIDLFGTPGSITQVYAPNTSKLYVVRNGSDSDVIFRATTSSSPVTGTTIISGGSGYASAPSVLFSLPTGAGGVQATGTATISGGVVTEIVITNPGSGYEEIPSISFSGGSPSVAASATAQIDVGYTISVDSLTFLWWDGSDYIAVTPGYIGGLTGAFAMPAGTTAERPANPSMGYLRFNDSLNQFEGYTGGSWEQVGGATGGGTDSIFYENGTNVTANYTISTGKNAMSAGPITIDSGITVTVPPGSVWTVVGA